MAMQTNVKKNMAWRLATSREMRAAGYARGKAACPKCGRLSYVMFVDAGGRVVNEECGRCDRENSCGYFLTPRDIGIKVHTADIRPLPQKKAIAIDFNRYVRPSEEWNRREHGTFVRWIYSLRWSQEQRRRIADVLRDYHVGRTADGKAIFWLIDEGGTVRSGKCMRYKADGHRDKGSFGTWVHSILEKRKEVDAEKEEYVGCAFGMHVAARHDSVHIVESEKSAILCAIYFGTCRFVATGGKSGFSRLRLLPLIQRKIPLYYYPDKDAEEEWDEKAKEIEYKNLYKVSVHLQSYDERTDPDNFDIGDYIIKKLQND